MKSTYSMSIQEAKLRLPIQEVWKQLQLPGTPGKSCRSPFRKDDKASFSIYENGLKWYDFATREGGDIVDFLMKALHLSRADACKELIKRVSGKAAIRKNLFSSKPSAVCRTTPNLVMGQLLSSIAVKEAIRRHNNPDVFRATNASKCGHMYCCYSDETETLSKLRQLSLEGLNLAQRRGLLRFWGKTSWIITDWQNVNAQERKLNGRPYGYGGPKALTFKGAWAAWPIGTVESRAYPKIVLCEGGLDLLAAFHFIVNEKKQDSCTAITMLGAAHNIPDIALTLLSGKCVRIFAHADDAGIKAGIRWGQQLSSVNCDVSIFNFSGYTKADGTPVKDLNDLTYMSPADIAANPELQEILP